MKTTIVLSSLFAFAMFTLVTQEARAADTGTLTISGEVVAVTELEIYNAGDSSAITTYTTLNLAAGQADTTIASIHEKCNDPDGYTMTLSSANAVADAGNLVYLKGADAGNTDYVAYSLKYGAVAVGLTAGAGTATVTDATDINSGFPAFTSKALSITITNDNPGSGENTGASGQNDLDMLPADVYTDVLTLTIAPKA